MKTFKHKTSKTAIFTVNGNRRQCVNGLYSTDDKHEIQFLSQNRNFDEYDPSKESEPVPENTEELKKELIILEGANARLEEKIAALTDENRSLNFKVQELEKSNELLGLALEEMDKAAEDSE